MHRYYKKRRMIIMKQNSSQLSSRSLRVLIESRPRSLDPRSDSTARVASRVGAHFVLQTARRLHLPSVSAVSIRADRGHLRFRLRGSEVDVLQPQVGAPRGGAVQLHGTRLTVVGRALKVHELDLVQDHVVRLAQKKIKRVRTNKSIYPRD